MQPAGRPLSAGGFGAQIASASLSRRQLASRSELLLLEECRVSIGDSLDGWRSSSRSLAPPELIVSNELRLSKARQVAKVANGEKRGKRLKGLERWPMGSGCIGGQCSGAPARRETVCRSCRLSLCVGPRAAESRRPSPGGQTNYTADWARFRAKLFTFLSPSSSPLWSTSSFLQPTRPDLTSGSPAANWLPNGTRPDTTHLASRLECYARQSGGPLGGGSSYSSALECPGIAHPFGSACRARRDSLRRFGALLVASGRRTRVSHTQTDRDGESQTDERLKGKRTITSRCSSCYGPRLLPWRPL